LGKGIRNFVVGKRRRRRRRKSEEDEAAAWWCVLLESAASSLARIFVLSLFFRFCVSLACCVLVLSISWEKSRMTSLKYIQKISAQTMEVEDPLPKQKNQTQSSSSPSCLSLSLKMGRFSCGAGKSTQRYLHAHVYNLQAQGSISESRKKRAPPHRVVVVKTSDAHVIQALGHFTSHTFF
jgi:hypothetical protein